MFTFIDTFLNKITMYRLTLYYLIALVGIAVILSFAGMLSYNPLDILLDTILAIITCSITNYFFAKFFHAVTNIESVFITALILVLIIPLKFPVNMTFFILASALAMGSKYILTVEKQHIFNPAAAAIAGISLLSSEHSATWWVGTQLMMPFVLIGGLLLMRKIRREKMVFTFLISYLIIIAGASFFRSGSVSSILTVWQTSIFHSSLFFLAFVMLTEPLTSPVTEKLQSYYSILVSILFATPELRLFSITCTPEIALCIGNVYSFFVSPKYRLVLPLQRKQQLSPDTYAFLFDRNTDFSFKPGQYLEWTLPHTNTDSRGNRRYFSIASSPKEKDLMIIIKFYTPSSSYKNSLLNLEQGKKIIASQLAGDFVLPEDITKPIVFIAGGVGIAPFRSMITSLIDNNLQANIILLFANRRQEDIIFADIFKKAEEHGVKTTYILTDTTAAPPDWRGRRGYLDEQAIKEEIPDYTNREFYISGPQLMVENFENMLLKIGVKRNSVKVDFFPGYSES